MGPGSARAGEHTSGGAMAAQHDMQQAADHPRPVVGTSVRRVEDSRILTGRGRYVHDVALPSMLHVAFVRSPLAHARVVSVDAEVARAAPGVRAAFTGRDMASMLGPLEAHGPEGYRAFPFGALATDKVRHVGDPVAMVVATSRALAEDACELVVVDYDPLPVVGGADSALAPGAPAVFDELGDNVIFRDRATYGDPDAAFAAADRVVRATVSQRRLAHVPMETRGIVADFDPRRRTLTVHAAHQAPHMLRLGLAAATGQAANRTRVLTADIGGSFGQKGVLGREEAAVAAASVALGVPCKWVEDRGENLTVAGHGRDEDVDVAAAVTADGRVLALRASMVLDQGAYPTVGLPSSLYPILVKILLPGPYRIEHLAFEATVVTTNKASYVAYRGPWEMETFARERLLDLVATELGLDPAAVRRVNLLRPEDQPARLATGPVLEGVTAAETFDRALELAGYDAFRAEQPRLRREGRLVGIGFATFLEPAPGPPSWAEVCSFLVPPERASVKVEPDGTVTVVTGQSPHGQSHETTLAQLAADRVGVPYESVRVVVGDTDVTPFSIVGTGGSRAATVASGAVLGAAAEVRRLVQEAASHLLEVDPEDVVVEGGMVMVAGVPATAVPLAAVARTAYMAPHLLGDGAGAGLAATYDFTAGRGGWVNATHCVEVEVSAESGAVDIRRYVVVEDCGRVIHPAVVEGQIRGGVAQGIGSVLSEHAAYDADGNFLTATLMDYLVPTAREVPHVEIEHVESPPLDGVGFRGVGEGGAVGAPAALVNAVADALAPSGARVTEKQLSPARILELAGVVPAAAPTGRTDQLPWRAPPPAP